MAIDTSVQGFTGFYEPPPQEAPVSTRDFLRGFLRGAQAGAASREFKKAKEELEAINRSREEGGFEALGPQGRTAFENRTGFSPDILENRKPPGAVQGILGAALGPDLQVQQGQLNQLRIAQEQRQSQLASRQFAAQDAYRNAVERDLAQAEAEAQAHGGTLDDETKVRIAAKHYLRYGATMGPGFGGALGGMISTGQRAATAEMTAEHRRGLLEAREKELNLSRDRLDEMSKQRDLDRQQKQALQDQKDAITRELETMKEQGRKDRSLLLAQTAIARASQIPDHMRRDAYKAEIQQLLNTFPSETEFDKGLQGIMEKYKVKPEPSSNPAEVVLSAPALPKASDRVKVRAPNGRIGTIPRSQLEQAKKEGFTEVK